MIVPPPELLLLPTSSAVPSMGRLQVLRPSARAKRVARISSPAQTRDAAGGDAAVEGGACAYRILVEARLLRLLAPFLPAGRQVARGGRVVTGEGDGRGGRRREGQGACRGGQPEASAAGAAELARVDRGRGVVRGSGGRPVAVPQQPQQLVRRGAGLGLLLQTEADEGEQLGRDVVEFGVALDHADRRLVGARAVEGAPARGGERDHRAQREDVGRRAHVLGSGELFRGHEGRGAHHAAGLGEDVGGGELGGAGDTEVDDAGAVVGEHHIGRLQVAVDHARAVDVADGLRQARGEFTEPGKRQRAVVAYVAAEVRTRYVERGHPGARRVGVRVHDRGREGAADLTGGGHLTAEPGTELVVVRVLTVHHLDRETPAGGGAGEVDHAHAAAAQTVLDAVTARLRRVRVAQHHPRRPPCSPLRPP